MKKVSLIIKGNLIAKSLIDRERERVREREKGDFIQAVRD